MKHGALLALLLTLPAAASAPETASLLYRPECVLEAVAARKNARLDPARRPPMVLLGSKIPPRASWRPPRSRSAASSPTA